MLASMASGTRLPSKLQIWARGLKREITALWFAVRDPATPWYAKALGFFIVGYAISPIDLIPDFIPVIGYLDDVIILPLGLALLRRLIPLEVMKRSRSKASERGDERLLSRAAGFIVVAVWIAVAVALVLFILNRAGNVRKP